MKIIGIEYTLKYRSLDIYISGCKTHCLGCHNPETWDFNLGDEYNVDVLNKINDYILSCGSLIENIMIFGGEPLDNDHNQLLKFLQDIMDFNKKIWLFTSKELDNIPNSIINCCDYIKTGKYLKDFKCESNEYFGINLATTNQKIHKI